MITPSWWPPNYTFVGKFHAKHLIDCGTNPKVAGVYRFICKDNGRYYVGESRSISMRHLQHHEDLRSGTGENVEFQEDWTTYGPESFVFEWLEFGEIFENDNFRRCIEDKYVQLNPELAYNVTRPRLQAADPWIPREINGVLYKNFSDLLLAFGMPKKAAKRCLADEAYVWPLPKLTLEEVEKQTQEGLLKKKFKKCKHQVRAGDAIYSTALEACASLGVSCIELNDFLRNQPDDYFFVDKNDEKVETSLALTFFGNVRRVQISGVTYPSVSEATRVTGFSASVINPRCEDPANVDFLYLDPPASRAFIAGKRVSVRGTIYPSVNRAALAEGIAVRTLGYWLENEAKPEYFYVKSDKPARVGRATPIFVKGVYYSSLTAAQKATKTDRGTLKKRCNTSWETDYLWAEVE